MVGITANTGQSAQDAASIWHKLIPGAAITLQVLLESFLSASFDSTQCNGQNEAIFRTIAFVLCWSVGLRGMKWTFESDKGKPFTRKIKHALINILVVTSWLFAISRFPLKCWLRSMEDQDADTIISTTQGMLVIFIQVIVSFEVFDVDLILGTTNAAEDTQVVTQEASMVEGGSIV
jgi:hypothetical protein